jgi:hypothetical protein
MRAGKSSRSRSISRRHLLTSAAGAGAAVAVAGLAGAAGAGAVTATPAASAERTADGVGGPVVVHVRDVASGVMDLFSGTQRIQIRDRALAERIAQAAVADPTTRSL